MFSPETILTLTRAALADAGTTFVVRWTESSGGYLDPTGALVSGTLALCSGTLRGFVHQEPARTVARVHAEIQTGDVILDLDPDPTIYLYPSGTETRLLDEIWDDTPKFLLGGKTYAPATLGERLASAWDATWSDARLTRTVLLRLEV